MSKKLLFTVIGAFVILLAALLTACGGGGTPTPSVSIPTLESIEMKRVNSDYVDPDNLLCLDVITESGEARTEEVRITVNFLNADKLPIVSFKVNDDLYNSSNWNADTINWSKITVRYRPKATSGDFEITVHSIFYRQSNAQKEIKHLSGNTKTVRIAPTFSLTINADEAIEPFNTKVDVKFMQSLYEVRALLKEADMNHADLRRESYTFTGWYTKPNGEGERINETGRYEFYKSLTVYAHYEPLYVYEVLTDEFDEEYAKILSLTGAGKLKFINLNMEERIDGYPIREIGTGAMQTLNAQSSIVLAEGIEVIGDNAFMGLKIRISLGNNIRKIGKNAFNGCTGLVNFFIPSSVKEIGDFAFVGTGWETTADNNGVLENRSAVSTTYRHKNTLFLPATLEVLGKEVFKGSTFEKVYFLEGSALTQIGEGIFSGSKSLTTVITSASFRYRDEIVGAAQGSVTLLPNNAFYDCPKLSSVTLSEGLNAIGNRAFASTVGFKNFKTVLFPASLESIGDYAFQNCHLTSINFADGSILKSIGDYAFENTKVREIDIKSSVLDNYGVSPFYNNWNLRLVTVRATTPPAFQKNDRDALQGLNGAKYVKYLVPKDSLTQYRRDWVLEGESWWSGVWKEELRIYAIDDIYTDTVNKLRIGYETLSGNDVILNFVIEEAGIAEKTNIEIPEVFDVGGVRKTVREIGKYLTNENIVTVKFPETLTAINDYAFEGCDRLVNVYYPSNNNNITKIGKYAFKGTAVTSFDSWQALTEIGDWAFNQCSALRNVRLIYGTSLSVGVSAFENSGLVTLAISSNVTAIYSSAFGYTLSLRYIYLDRETPPAASQYGVGPFRGAGGAAANEEGMNIYTKIYLPHAQAKSTFEGADFYKAYKSNYKVLEGRSEWIEQGFPQ